jgi:hypothetical protein
MSIQKTFKLDRWQAGITLLHKSAGQVAVTPGSPASQRQMWDLTKELHDVTHGQTHSWAGRCEIVGKSRVFTQGGVQSISVTESPVPERAGRVMNMVFRETYGADKLSKIMVVTNPDREPLPDIGLIRDGAMQLMASATQLIAQPALGAANPSLLAFIENPSIDGWIDAFCADILYREDMTDHGSTFEMSSNGRVLGDYRSLDGERLRSTIQDILEVNGPFAHLTFKDPGSQTAPTVDLKAGLDQDDDLMANLLITVNKPNGHIRLTGFLGDYIEQLQRMIHQADT